MTKHHDTNGSVDQQQITLRGPAELADALPYVMGFRPTDSVVLVALHGDTGRFGGRLRLGIPRAAEEWPCVAEQLAQSLVEGSVRRGRRPDGIVVFLCQDPAEGETGVEVMERLRPFAQRLRTACGALDVPVREALCVSGERLWSYCCPDARCCPPEGTEMVLPGTSVMAAAATYAGIQVRGSLRDMEERLASLRGEAATAQERVLDEAQADILPVIVGEGERGGRARIATQTLCLARTLIERLAGVPAATSVSGAAAADAADDRLISDHEAALVVLGLQDRETRDRAAAWMEGAEAEPAVRLWRALARRCVGAYVAHATAPLTLAGWVAWSSGDEPAARVALGRALELDPGYAFARLLHQACNEGLDPEALRACLRAARGTRRATGSSPGTRRRRAAQRPKVRAGRSSRSARRRPAAALRGRPGRRGTRSRQ